MKSDGLKVGEPDRVHHGKVFKRLYIGYSLEHGQRFFVPLSPLQSDVQYLETRAGQTVISNDVKIQRRFMGETGSAVLRQAINAPLLRDSAE